MSLILKRSLLGAAIALLLAGCSVLPNPISKSEVNSRYLEDQKRLYYNQEALTKPLTFDEAVARALKYNLDYRLKLMESALSKSQLSLTNYDMLPNLLASAGYTSRNNDSGGNSVNIETGAISLQNSTSQDRTRSIAEAEFSWNVLDFGLSYYRAKQMADEHLIAEERRQRVIQNILRDVRSSYWRALGAQRLVKKAEGLTEKVRAALDSSRQAEKEGLIPPRDALITQRVLLDSLALLVARRQELEYAKRELQALLNIPPGTQFSLADIGEPDLLPVSSNIDELEKIALTNRPELLEEDYRARITASEARQQLLSLLPGIDLSLGGQYDSNQYLYNTRWINATTQITYDLFKLLSFPAMRSSHEALVNDDTARRLALSMAIITQVRLSVERYRLAVHNLEIARDSSDVDQRLEAFAQAALTTKSEGKLQLIQAEVNAINSEYKRFVAYATAQTAFGRIYNSLGLSVVPHDLTNASIEEAAAAVAANIHTLEQEIFSNGIKNSKNIEGAEAAVAANVHTLEQETFSDEIKNSKNIKKLNLQLSVSKKLSQRVNGLDVRDVIINTLESNQIYQGTEGDNIARLVVGLYLHETDEGLQENIWVFEVFDPSNQPLGSTVYSSVFSETLPPKAYESFAKEATEYSLTKLKGWLDTWN